MKDRQIITAADGKILEKIAQAGSKLRR